MPAVPSRCRRWPRPTWKYPSPPTSWALPFACDPPRLTAAPAVPLSRQRYETDGFVAVPGVFTAEECDRYVHYVMSKKDEQAAEAEVRRGPWPVLVGCGWLVGWLVGWVGGRARVCLCVCVCVCVCVYVFGGVRRRTSLLKPGEKPL